jgi:uncharacterized protein
MYVKRDIEELILKAGKSFPCIVVYGPRQVGKSTTVNYLFDEKVKRVTLDDIEDRSLAKSNPRLFIENLGTPVIIYEIQKVPELLNEIKKVIDEKRMQWLKNNEERQLLYILTGSNRFELQEGVSESLAGRCAVTEMLSLSLSEKKGYGNIIFNPEISEIKKRENTGRKYMTAKEIFEDIFNGGMPDVFTGVSERNMYYKSYINTYIEKDILKIIDVSSELQFRSFLTAAAFRTGCELHYDELANAVGIDVRTCKKWISVLRLSGIIYLLQPFLTNKSNRVVKAPKLYFTDTGLCAFLCKWQDGEMLQNCAMSGAFFETYVVSEIIKNMYANGTDPNSCLYYYRDSDQKEIDLIYESADGIYPIEIKKGKSPTKPNKNFDVLEKYKLNIKPGIIIDTCEKIRAINESVYTLPVHLI